MPLFWQHGEEDDTLLNYVDRLIESGAGGFVVDGRVPAEHRARKLDLETCACQGCPFWAGRQSVSVDPL